MNALDIQSAAQAGADSGFVYCIGRDVAGAVKIGWSRDPEQRLAQLQTASPDTLRILAILPGSKNVEHGLHEVFGDCAIRGEWFDSSGGTVAETFNELLTSFFGRGAE